MIDKLCDEGYLERHPTMPNMATITPKGAERVLKFMENNRGDIFLYKFGDEMVKTMQNLGIEHGA